LTGHLGWLPLHWAAAIHDTEPEDMKAVIQARPFNAVKGHLHCGNIGEQEAGDQSYRGLLPLHFAVSVQHPNILNDAQWGNAFSWENPNTLAFTFPAAATTGNPGGNWVQYRAVSNRVDGVVVTLPPVIRHQSVYDADRDVLWLWHGEYVLLCSKLP
jgi:hypothetical protein